MKIIAAILLLSATVATPAFAADSGFYGALDVQSWSATNTAPLGNPGMGASIAAGYHFTENWGAEIGYGQSGSSSSYQGASYKLNSTQLAAVGTYPINPQFDVFAKLGMAANSASVSGPGTNCTNCSKTDLLYGVGGQYNINKQIGIRLQYVNIGKVTNSGSNDVSATNISLGAVYNF